MAKQPAIPVVGTGGQPARLELRIKTPDKTLTEDHWHKETADLNDAQLLKDAQDLANARSQMLPSGCSLIGWRLSQENVFGDSVYNPPGNFTPSTITDTIEQGNDCIPTFMSGTTQYRRTMFLGAIPDDVITNDALDLATDAAWFAAMRRYYIILTGKDPYAPPGSPAPAVNNSWGFLPRRAPTTGFPKANIVGWVFTNNSPFVQVTTDIATNVVEGDVVQIRGVSGVNAQFPMNQLWVVSTADPGTPTVFVIQGFPPSTIPPALPLRLGTVRKMWRAFQLYDGYALGSPGERKRGNSIGQQKARNKKKWNIGFPG